MAKEAKVKRLYFSNYILSFVMHDDTQISRTVQPTQNVYISKLQYVAACMHSLNALTFTMWPTEVTSTVTHTCFCIQSPSILTSLVTVHLDFSDLGKGTQTDIEVKEMTPVHA